MSLAPEGRSIIIFCAAAFAGAYLLSYAYPHPILSLLPVATALALIAVLVFFRDPARTIPDGDNLVLAPADGRIIGIESRAQNPLGVACTTVSIFMSPLNVHVNRSPVSGRVVGINRQRGRFMPAYQSAAGVVNENVTAFIDAAGGSIAMRQIAGRLARRIVFHPREGDAVKAGERVGIIKFGSRVDLFLPRSVEIRVKLRDKVRGGESIIGAFPNV